jgi:hypothetical protein
MKKFILPAFIFCFLISCNSKKPVAVNPDFSGNYVGAIYGTYFASNFPAVPQEPFYTDQTISLVKGDMTGELTGLDSIPFTFKVDPNKLNTFSVNESFSGGGEWVNSTGIINGDTLTLTGSKYNPDRSRRVFKFIGLKKSGQ